MNAISNYGAGFGYAAPEYQSKTASGKTPLTVKNAKTALPFGITVYGNTSEGVGVGDIAEGGLYEIPITVSGKNLLDPASSFSLDGISAQDEPISVLAAKISARPHTAYTCSTDTPLSDYNGKTVAAAFISTLAKVPSTGSNGVSYGAPRSITTDETGVIYIFIRTVQTYNELILSPDDLISGKYHIQVEQNSIATDFEPYRAPKSFYLYSTEALADKSASLTAKPYKQSALLLKHNEKPADISAMQQWDNIPVLNNGTNIFTVNTSVYPSGIKIKYMP